MTSRCTDCRTRLRGEFFVDHHYPGVEVCGDCAQTRRAGDPRLFWVGMEWVREAPAVVPILLGTYTICACLMLVWIFSGRLG